MTFLRVGIIVAITACVVYFGLNLLFPRNLPEKQQGAATTPDQVFGSTTTATPAAPAGQSAQGLSEDEARKIAEDVGRKVGTEVAQSVVDKEKGQGQPAAASSDQASSSDQAAASAQPAASSEQSSSTSEQAPAATPPPSQASASPPPAETAAAQPAEPASPPPAEEAAPPAEAPAPAPHKHKAPASETAAAEPAKASGKGKGKHEPDADAITAWWPKTDQQSSSHLNLVYAGEAAFEDAAVVMFSSPVDASAGSHIQVLDRHGHEVKGGWERGGNPRMLLFKTKPGRYTLVLAADLPDSSGKTLGTALHGPVYVH